MLDAPVPRPPFSSLASPERSFVVGVFVGILLGVAVYFSLVYYDDSVAIRESVDYSISALAVDTEKNARMIVELSERVKDLESLTQALPRRD